MKEVLNKSKRKSPFAPKSFETSNGSHFSRIYEDMMESWAFKGLSNEAKALYLYMKMQYKGIEKSVMLPYDFIRKNMRIGNKKIKKLVTELQWFGFIEVKHIQLRPNVQPANVYTFIDVWAYTTEDEAENLRKEFNEKIKAFSNER